MIAHPRLWHDTRAKGETESLARMGTPPKNVKVKFEQNETKPFSFLILVYYSEILLSRMYFAHESEFKMFSMKDNPQLSDYLFPQAAAGFETIISRN